MPKSVYCCFSLPCERRLLLEYRLCSDLDHLLHKQVFQIRTVFHLGTAGDGSDVQRRIMLKKK